VVERAVYRAPRADRMIAEVQFDPFDSPYRPAPRRSTAVPAPRCDTTSGEAAPALPETGQAPRDFRTATTAYERTLLERALARNRHHQRKAAADLGLSYDQLRHQLRKHGLLPAASGAA